MKMRILRRSLLLVTCFAAASLPASLNAIEVEESSQQLQSLIAEVRELLPVIHGQLRDLRYTMQRAEQSTGDPSRALDSSYEYRELKRSTSRMTEIGNSVYTLTSRCGADGKKVGSDFKSSVRRLNTHVNRIASSSTPTFARHATDDLEGDLEEIAGKLPSLAAVPECTPESADDEESSSKSE
jgi:archaellum component FlaC